MYRNGASRLALRSIGNSALRPARPVFANPVAQSQWTSKLCTLSSKRPQTVSLAQLKPVQTALFHRSPAWSSVYDKIDKEKEKEIGQKKLDPTPETVSATSSIHPVVGEVGTGDPERDVDMMKGLKHDIVTVKETFDLSGVPRQAYVIGLAGVLPYLATSLSTVYCAWEIHHASAAGGYGFMMSGKTAEAMLHLLEPLQIGYGAVIISFLGAIHWGLEWAGYGGYQGYKRYAIGVVAPAVAWPTILMPVEYALITQFMAFTVLYNVDTRATYRGWTPPWYNIYRFVLTFIVGVSIVVSLIGRGEVAHKVGRLPGATDRVQALQDSTQTLAKEEEAEILRNQAKQAEEGNDKEGADDEGKSEDKEEDGDDKEGGDDEGKSKDKEEKGGDEEGKSEDKKE